MKFISNIPVFKLNYTYGIKSGEFFINNLATNKEVNWKISPITPREIEGYTRMHITTSNRIFLAGDESDSSTWLIIETKHQLGIINAPWKEILTYFRSSICDLDDGDYYIKNVTPNYCLSIGNFYLYPELNPLGLTLKYHRNNLTIGEILTSDFVKTQVPLKTCEYIPNSKLTRFRAGIVVSKGNVWWIDKRENMAWLLNNYFFESATDSGLKDVVAVDNSFTLPREVDGRWNSPTLTNKQINAVLAQINKDNTYVIPGNRVAQTRAATRDSAGEYIVPTLGRFGRYTLTDTNVVKIRGLLGTDFAIQIVTDTFQGVYVADAVHHIYLRQEIPWAEPKVEVVEEEKVEELVEEPTEEVAVPEADIVTYKQGWSFFGSDQPTSVAEAIAVKSIDDTHAAMTQPLPTLTEHLGDLGAPVDLSVSIETPQETTSTDTGETPTIFDTLCAIAHGFKNPKVTEIVEDAPNPEVVAIVEDTPAPKSMAHFHDLRLGQVMVNPNVLIYGKLPPSVPNEAPAKLIGAVSYMDIGIIQLPAPYGHRIAWFPVVNSGDLHPMKQVAHLEDGEYFSTANATYIRLKGRHYVAHIHLNFN